MKKLFTTLLFLTVLIGVSQNINDRFDKWPVLEKPINITGIDISPDGKTVALVCGGNQDLILYDYKSKSVIKEIKLESGAQGYNVYYSKKGNYLLIQERKIETSIKKAKKADYYVVDINAGKVVQRFNKINDAEISADEKSVVVLENSTVTYRDIKSGDKLKEFKPEDAMNALALSPDGKDLAVVKKPTKADVKMLVSKNVEKKRIKAAAKVKHLITVYDTETFELKTLIPEFYDNINLLFYRDRGEKLISFNMGTNSYVNVAMAKEGYRPTREGYSSRTSTQPDFSYSPDSRFFGIASFEKFPSINIYNVDTGSAVDTYDTKMKIWKNIKKKIYPGTNTSFVFLPDNKHVLIAYGNSLIKWKYKKD